MYIKIYTEFQCLERENSNVYKNRAKIPLFLLHMGSPTCDGGAVCMSPRLLELCQLESCTPGKTTHAKKVEG